jgi:hypothetical protein
MGSAAVVEAFEAINAALAVLNAEAAGCGSEPFSDADPLAGLADGCLEILAGAAGVQAMVSGLVANAAGTYADTRAGSSSSGRTGAGAGNGYRRGNWQPSGPE